MIKLDVATFYLVSLSILLCNFSLLFKVVFFIRRLGDHSKYREIRDDSRPSRNTNCYFDASGSTTDLPKLSPYRLSNRGLLSMKAKSERKPHICNLFRVVEFSMYVIRYVLSYQQYSG